MSPDGNASFDGIDSKIDALKAPREMNYGSYRPFLLADLPTAESERGL